MSLSCSCDGEFDHDGYFYLDVPSDYSILENRKRRPRCQSCKELINIGDLCTEFSRARFPKNVIEEIIHDEFVYLSSKYLCECCSDIYFSLYELGFTCISPDENMRHLAWEYNEIYGRKQEAKP